MLAVRAARGDDSDGIWAILEPIIRAGDTYALPPGTNRQEGLAYWFSHGNEVFVAEDDGRVDGTIFFAPIKKVVVRT